MRRPARDLRAARSLLDRAESLVRRLRDHRCAVDFGMPPMVMQDASGAPIAREDAGRLQFEQYRARIDVRREAVSSLHTELCQVASELGDDLPTHCVTRFVGCSEVAFLCQAMGQGVPRPAIRNLCQWACPFCCGSALEEVDAVRDDLEQQLAVAVTVRRGNPRGFKKDGSLTAAAQRFVDALPPFGQPAKPTTLENIAKKAQIGFDAIRKLSVALQREGMVACDQDGCWRRVVAPEG